MKVPFLGFRVVGPQNPDHEEKRQFLFCRNALLIHEQLTFGDRGMLPLIQAVKMSRCFRSSREKNEK